MPLKAIIENTEIISTFLTKNDWLDLMNRVKSENIDVIIYQTSKKGYLRTSKNGIQHFVHKKGEKPKNWNPESPEHLFIKNEILLACKSANWSANPEFSENDWEADVLTSKNSRRIAFEVQLSYQTLDKTIERQDKFVRDKVIGCWFFKKIPKGLNQFEANNHIPFFKIATNIEKEIEVQFYDKKIPIRKFINYLLEGKVKYCNTITPKVKQKVTLKIFELKCPGCGTIWNNYIVEGELNTNCNLKIPLDESFFVKNKFKHHPDILSKLKELEKENKFVFGRLKTIKIDNEKTIDSFGCRQGYCDKNFHDFDNHFLKEDENWLETIEIIKTYELIVELNNYKRDKKHWCFSNERKFCK